MKCYSCDGYILKPVKLDYGLPARECDRCHGLHIDLLTYRSWRESNQEAIEHLDLSEEVFPSDNQKTLLCQRCGKIMLKYRISGETDNYIDICSHCDDAWLDDGEWDLLKQLHLLGKLPEISSEPWQRSIRQASADHNLTEKYTRLLGETEFARLQETGSWIAAHPQRREILAFLTRKVYEKDQQG